MAMTGVPNLRLIATMWCWRASPTGEDLTGSRIDPVVVEVDELEVVFAREMPNGINVSHASSSAD